MNANEKAVAEVLAQYQAALNQSDTDAVMKLYASDGVFMPQNSPSSVGAEEVRRAYEAVFKTIQLTVKFNVAEIVEVAPNWVLRAPIRPGRSRFTRRAQVVPRRIRNYSCSNKLAEPGRSRATAFRRQTHRAHEK